MKNLNEDLKTGNIKQAYLLYGEEAYLKKQYRDRLTKAVLPEGDTVNYAHYEGKGINVPEIIDLAETMPFFCRKASHCDLKILAYLRMQMQSSQIILRACRKRSALYLWRVKLTSGVRCIRL